MAICTIGAIAIWAGAAMAQNFDVSWHTVNGGGGQSAGGAFAVSGTIGQPDAGPAAGVMTGGNYELTGGFWAGAAVPGCNCLGDMNTDGQRNGGDIQLFVDCLLMGGSCQCADVDGLSGITLEDADAFILDLLSAGSCP